MLQTYKLLPTVHQKDDVIGTCFQSMSNQHNIKYWHGWETDDTRQVLEADQKICSVKAARLSSRDESYVHETKAYVMLNKLWMNMARQKKMASTSMYIRTSIAIIILCMDPNKLNQLKSAFTL